MNDLISRQAAIDALWKALYEYEDETEKQFLESEELDIATWFLHRIFVQNMSDIDRQTILNLPSVQPERRKGKWISVPHKRARICSICSHDEPYKFADEETDIYNYCPYCGADMQERSEE